MLGGCCVFYFYFYFALIPRSSEKKSVNQLIKNNRPNIKYKTRKHRAKLPNFKG